MKADKGELLFNKVRAIGAQMIEDEFLRFLAGCSRWELYERAKEKALKEMDATDCPETCDGCALKRSAREVVSGIPARALCGSCSQFGKALNWTPEGYMSIYDEQKFTK